MGLLDRIKNKRQESLQPQNTSSQNNSSIDNSPSSGYVLDDLSYDLFDTPIPSSNSTQLDDPSLAAEIKEIDDRYNKTVEETETFISDTEQRISELNNLPGAKKSKDIASETARELEREYQEKAYNEKYGVLFNRITAYFFDKEIGISLSTDDKKFDEIFAKVLVDGDYKIEDVLIPFYIAKAYYRILTPREANIVNEANERYLNNSSKVFECGLTFLRELAQLEGKAEDYEAVEELASICTEFLKWYHSPRKENPPESQPMKR